MLKRFGLYIALFWSLTSQAQYVSKGGAFSINNQRGCRDMLVRVSHTVQPPDSIVVLFLYEGRDSTPTPDTTFLYTTTGNYWLYRFIQNDQQRIDSIYVEILDPVIPQFELNACGANEVQVDIQDNNYDVYEIDYGDGQIDLVPVNTFPPNHSYSASATINIQVTGLYSTASNRCGVNSRSFTPVNQVIPANITLLETIDNQSLIIHYSLADNTRSSLEISVNNTNSFQLYKNIAQGSTTDTLTNLQLNIATYCFRIASHDACSNFKAYSNTLCSIFTEAQGVNNAINLTWKTAYPANNSAVTVLRDSSLLTTLTNQALSYSDSTVQCNTSFCYSLESQHSDGSISRSNQACAEAFSSDKPSPVDNISAIISANEIRWNWLVNANEQVKQYRVYNQNSILIETTQSNSLVTPYDNEPDVCIQVDFTNTCDNISDKSALVCPLIISRTLNSDGSVGLDWQAYAGWANGVSNYSVVIYDRDMVILDSVSVGLDTEYVDPLPDDNNQVTYYRLWANPFESGVSIAASNLIRVEREAIIGIPTSFTPNGDNLNDEFVISGKFIETIELSIINRWGSTIYQVNGTSWDGTSNGQKVPIGNYIYHLIAKDFAGNELIRSGTVLILKD